jgi:hypothetical protein
MAGHDHWLTRSLNRPNRAHSFVHNREDFLVPILKFQWISMVDEDFRTMIWIVMEELSWIEKKIGFPY